MNDLLLEHLLDLEKEFSLHDVRLIVGGGLSLYLRQVYRPSSATRYPFHAGTRSTDDIDLFLSSEIIVNKEKVEKIKDALRTLGYRVVPEARNFQFSKTVNLFGQDRALKVDLLSEPPKQIDLQKVEISKPRIKPKGVSDFHAYLTHEASGIGMGIIEMEVEGQIFSIPSAYNYLILKLNAFDDRKERKDEGSDFGRHHAYDIFVTVSLMDEEEWEKAEMHFQAHREQDYLKKTCQIQKTCFSKTSDIGVIRLQENISYRNRKSEFDPYLGQFINDMNDLFGESQ